MRKRRVQGTLFLLPADQRATLNGWLVENLHYKVIRERLKTEFGVETSDGALANYFRRVGSQLFAAVESEGGTKNIVVPPGWEAVVRVGNTVEISIRPHAG